MGRSHSTLVHNSNLLALHLNGQTAPVITQLIDRLGAVGIYKFKYNCTSLSHSQSRGTSSGSEAHQMACKKTSLFKIFLGVHPWSGIVLHASYGINKYTSCLPTNNQLLYIMTFS